MVQSIWRLLSLVLSLSILLPYAAALPRRSPVLETVQRALVAPPPSQDPFYKPPAGFASKAPGTILRTRNVTNVLLAQGNLPVVLKGLYQLLYRTTNSAGKATASVTTVLVPPNADPKKHVSHQVAYDQADWDCSVSYAFESPASNETSYLQTELLFIDASLLKGYIVSSSDYEGPQAAFTSGPQAAYGVLDSIRAALASGSLTGLSSSAKTVMLGYSGGALATGWAAQYAKSYAPELNIIGVAMGGVPVNISSSIDLVNGGASAGLIPAALNGLANGYADFRQALYSKLVPATAAFFKRPLTECQAFAVGPGGYASDFANMDVFKYFTNGRQVLNDPTVAKTINTVGVLGQKPAPTKIPFYIFQSMGDHITYYPDSNALAHKWCNAGTRVTFTGYTNGSHPYAAFNGVGRAFQWVEDRMAGIPAPAACDFKLLNASYNPDVQGVALLPAPIAAEVLVLLAALTATGM